MEVVRHLKRYGRLALRTLDQALIPGRYAFRRVTLSNDATTTIGRTPQELPVQVINLASRPDRLKETQAELKRMGLKNWVRFEAQRSDDGALGCSLSHATLLQGFEESKTAVMVCEDDIEFLVGPEELTLILEDFLSNPALDVLCVANHLVSRPFPLFSRLALTANSATTACYVAKERAIPLLKESFFESATLISQGKPLGLAAADQHWKKLQRRTLLFAVPKNRVARQRPSFSDIEGREVSYGV